VTLDVDNKMVVLSDGRVFSFGRCLLATGSKEARLPGPIPPKLAEHVTNLRKVKDFDRVQRLVREGKVKRIVVVGGGFLGCEVATKLAEQGKEKGVEVVHAYVEPGALYRYVPVFFSDYVTQRLRGMGIKERPYHMVLSIQESQGHAANLQLVLQGFEQAKLDCDHLIFAPTHLEGNVELARASGLEIDGKCGGVMVNAELMARTDVYVAGDTASYPDAVLGRRRIQCYDHSYHSGALAARNMVLGGRDTYNHLPVITSSGAALGLEVAVLGDIDSNMEMLSIAQLSSGSAASGEGAAKVSWDQWEKGIVYYLRDRKVVGALVLNMSERVEDVRKLIRSGTVYKNRSEQGIPELEHALDLRLASPVYRLTSARGAPTGPRFGHM